MVSTFHPPGQTVQLSRGSLHCPYGHKIGYLKVNDYREAMKYIIHEAITSNVPSANTLLEGEDNVLSGTQNTGCNLKTAWYKWKVPLMDSERSYHMTLRNKHYIKI